MTSDINHRTHHERVVDRRGDPDRPFAGIWWLMVLRGLAGIVFGLVAVFAPASAVLSLLLILGVYLIVDGVFGLISALLAGQRQERWGLLVAESVLNLVIGFVVFIAPDISLVVFMLLLA